MTKTVIFLIVIMFIDHNDDFYCLPWLHRYPCVVYVIKAILPKPCIIWCFECDEGLCSECKDHHSRSKGTREHCSVQISEYQKIPSDVVKITQTCDKHNEKYTFYCKKHAYICCGSCIVENHMECRDFYKLADVIQNTKLSNAFYEIEQSLEELSENIQIIREDREHNLKRLTEKKRQIEQDIKQTRATINNHLDKIQDDIIKKLNEIEVNKSKIISELLISLKGNYKEITEYRTNIKNIKQHASDMQAFIAVKDLETKLRSKDEFLQCVRNSENLNDHELSYNANVIMRKFANHIKNFGEVNIETRPSAVVLTRQKDIQAQIMLPYISSKPIKHIKLNLLKTINGIGECITGCCMLPDGKMAFSYDSDKSVRVINSNGTKHFGVITPASAYDIAYINHDNTLVVTSGSSDTKCITIIDIQSKQIKKTIPVDSALYGIAVTSDGKFICSAAGKGIQLINPHKNSTIDIIRDEITWYSYVAIFGDKIYNTNTCLNVVTCYDLQGSEQWSFKNERILRGPQGISIDNDGRVYVVADTSKNVVVLSPDGQQYKEITTARNSLCYPVSLDYDGTKNQLLVTNYCDRAMIFNLI